jgi:DNA polymerase V
MQALDALNERFGPGTIRSASCETAKNWAMRSGARSPRFMTQWDELPVANNAGIRFWDIPNFVI